MSRLASFEERGGPASAAGLLRRLCERHVTFSFVLHLSHLDMSSEEAQSDGQSSPPMDLGHVWQKARPETNWISLIGAGLRHVPHQLYSGTYYALTQLYLGHNKIRRVPAAFFTQSPSLRGRYLQNNLLETLPPEISYCTELRELYLSQNKLRLLPPLGELPLDCLWLDDNPDLPATLQRNVSRDRKQTTILVNDIARYYNPREEKCRRAMEEFLLIATFRPPFVLPLEIAAIVTKELWLHRFDDEWKWE